MHRHVYSVIIIKKKRCLFFHLCIMCHVGINKQYLYVTKVFVMVYLIIAEFNNTLMLWG